MDYNIYIIDRLHQEESLKSDVCRFSRYISDDPEDDVQTMVRVELTLTVMSILLEHVLTLSISACTAYCSPSTHSL